MTKMHILMSDFSHELDTCTYKVYAIYPMSSMHHKLNATKIQLCFSTYMQISSHSSNFHLNGKFKLPSMWDNNLVILMNFFLNFYGLSITKQMFLALPSGISSIISIHNHCYHPRTEITTAFLFHCNSILVLHASAMLISLKVHTYTNCSLHSCMTEFSK
jgi:hypothetical protein